MDSLDNKNTDVTFSLWNPSFGAPPLFEFIDVDIGLGDGLYIKMVEHFRRHYNFLRARAGREQLPENFPRARLLWYMLVYLTRFLEVFVELLIKAIEKEAEKKSLIPSSFFSLEVESIHMKESLFNSVKPWLGRTHIAIRPSRLALKEGRSGYIDCTFKLWAQVSSDGKKVYLTQVADLLLSWFFLEYVSILNASFSWMGFVRQSGDIHFSRLIGMYSDLWTAFESSSPRGEINAWAEEFRRRIPPIEEFAEFFTTFRRSPYPGQGCEDYDPSRIELGYDFFAMWGGVELLLQTYFDLLASVYLRFFFSIYPEKPDSLIYGDRPRDLASYIWGTPNFYFLWDFMLSWNFADYFQGFPFYTHGKFAGGELSYQEDPKPLNMSKIGSRPLYNPGLVSESEKEELLFFVSQAKKEQIRVSRAGPEDALMYNTNAWPIFCFSSEVGVPFREGEEIDRNWALKTIPVSPRIKPSIVSGNMWDILFWKYLRLVESESYAKEAASKFYF